MDTCVTRDYKKCDPSDPTECVGERETNFVYGVDLPGDLLSAEKVIMYNINNS